jgi:hypothetical protein
VSRDSLIESVGIRDAAFWLSGRIPALVNAKLIEAEDVPTVSGSGFTAED